MSLKIRGEAMRSIAEFDVPGQPVGKARPRVERNRWTGQIHTRTPDKTVFYENRIIQCFHEACGDNQLEGCVEVWIEAYFTIPASWSKKKKLKALNGEILPKGKPDIDNIAKIVLDGLNKAKAWEDDARVVDLHCKKRYAEEPHLHVSIERKYYG